MVSENNKLLQKAFSPTFKTHSFLKNGANWRRASAEAIVVFNIQGSQWGPYFYLNLGSYLRQLGPETAPPSYRCHVQVRLCRLVPDIVLLRKLLDFGEDIPASDRGSQLAELVTEFALPWLQTMSACETAGHYLKERPSLARSMYIARAAQELLGISAGDQESAATDQPPESPDRA